MRTRIFTSDSPRERRKGRSWALRALAAAALLAAGLETAACVPTSDSAGDLGVELAFDPAPRVGPTTCTIRLADADGAPVAGATVTIEGNMNHAGMVPEFGTGHEAAPGRYEAPLEFTMGGDWFVIVKAELADGRSIEKVVPVPGVAVPGRKEAGPTER